jgi:hypothetical protein
MPVGVIGAAARRPSSWDGNTFRGAPVEVSRLSVPQGYLQSGGVTGPDSHEAYSRYQLSADGLTLRPSNPAFSDAWSSQSLSFEYVDLKPISMSGEYFSLTVTAGAIGGDLSLLPPPGMSAGFYSQAIAAYDTMLMLDWYLTASLPGDLQTSVSMATGGTSPSLTGATAVSGGKAVAGVASDVTRLSTAVSGAKAVAGYTSDSNAPLTAVHEGAYAAPEALAITALPSSESTPTTTSFPASAAVAVSGQSPAAPATVAIAAAQSLTASPFASGPTSTLGSLVRADMPSLAGWISTPLAEQSGSKVVAAPRDAAAPQTATAALGLAARVARSTQAGPALLPLKSAASLVEMPIDLGRIEQKLAATIADIKHLTPDLAGWLNIARVSPLTIAFATAAIGGGSAYYYLRRRGAREIGRLEDEESSSWLFSRLHSAASQ